MSSARVAALRAQADALAAQALAVRAEADALELESATKPANDPIVFATIDEAAREFDVSRRTIFDWLRDGMPSVKRGVKRRVPIDQARRWLEEMR
jgi:excisionase family DNA binding protein